MIMWILGGGLSFKVLPSAQGQLSSHFQKGLQEVSVLSLQFAEILIESCFDCQMLAHSTQGLACCKVS